MNRIQSLTRIISSLIHSSSNMNQQTKIELYTNLNAVVTDLELNFNRLETMIKKLENDIKVVEKLQKIKFY
jgi:exonuclease VII small subunit